MILVVVDPNFVPFAAVQFAARLDVHLACCASAQRKVKSQLIVTGQRDHKRWVVVANGRLKQKDRLFASGAERKGDVALAPAGHFDVGLRRGKGDYELLGICKF